MTERFAGPSSRLLAPPGGATQLITKAPPRALLDSKRVTGMESMEVGMVEQEVVLDEGTRQRNREFQRRMMAVESRQEEWAILLSAEERNRDKEHEDVLAEIKGKLDRACTTIWDKIDADFSVFHTEHIPPLEKKMEVQEEDFDLFINFTVPKAIDECSEAIARKVEKGRETFVIENTKVMKREEKIVERFERHVGRTRQGVEDEEATRIGKLHLLTEEIDAPERIDERLEENQLTTMMAELVAIRKQIKAEAKERAMEDNLVLDEMLRTQQKLQQSVLENFGSE